MDPELLSKFGWSGCVPRKKKKWRDFSLDLGISQCVRWRGNFFIAGGRRCNQDDRCTRLQLANYVKGPTVIKVECDGIPTTKYLR
jgi:hypothetical protein